MRPHKLLMKAFGPFANETIVDFDAMGNNIYLISGDTGSGKTTIFDGIIYALYGTASGGARSGLGTEAFHSDYAKEGTHRDEMRVEFTFSNAGRTFTIVRRMYWGKKGDSKIVSKEATLSENGNTLVSAKGREDRDDVTEKVTEILGLDADQFKRIIMLAQGEFQKFLTAKSDERGTILGKLYDNRKHQDFQLRLKAAAALLKEQENAAIEEEKAQLKVFVFPEDVSEEGRAAVTVDHPEMLLTVSRLIDDIRFSLTKKSELIEAVDEEKRKLEEQKTQAETCNGLLKDLEKKQEERKRLDTQKGEMDSLSLLVDRAEAAEKALPYKTAAEKTHSDWVNSQNAIKGYEQKCDELEEKEKELQKAIEKVQAKNEEPIKKNTNRKNAVTEMLHLYDELADAKEEFEKKQHTKNEATTEANKAEEEALKKERRLKEIEEELRKLANAGDAAVELARKKRDDINLQWEDLNGVSSGIKRVNVLLDEQQGLAEEFENTKVDEINAERNHFLLNSAFLQGQAGILAQELRTELQTKREVVCPVCGAVHTAEDVDSFAPWHEDIPTKEIVDAAYQVWEQARNKRINAEEKLAKKNNEILQEETKLLEKAKKWLPVTSWEDLTMGSVLSDALAACGEARQQANGDYNKAVSDATAKEKSLEEQENTDKEYKEAKKKVEETARTKATADDEAKTAEALVNMLKRQLEGFPENKTDAEKLIEELDKTVKELNEQIDVAKKTHEECTKEQASNQGKLESAYNAEKENKLSKEQAEKEWFAQLGKQHFASESDYEAALSPERVLLDSEALASWIDEKKKVIENYNNNVRDLESAIKQLKASTKDMKYVNVEALTTRINDVKGQLIKERTAEGRLKSMLLTNQEVKRSLSRIQKQRDLYQKAHSKLNPLAETADGKYSFSRYVLSGFFHRIVEQANIHLETMTDGEYSLVPKETGDGRSTIGLELKVLNTITNLERDTASLSGGQLFEASLSLALGLSDIVQMESTSSIQIDSMFIDEGFGSLDGGRLDKAIEVLQHLSAGKRQIGIISHVARLDECLPKKIYVIAGERGSTIKVETDA